MNNIVIRPRDGAAYVHGMNAIIEINGMEISSVTKVSFELDHKSEGVVKIEALFKKLEIKNTIVDTKKIYD